MKVWMPRLWADLAGSVLSRFFVIILSFLPHLAYAQDVSPPEIVSFSFCPTAIDTTRNHANVYVTIAAKDNLSGVDHLGAAFRSPSGAQTTGGGADADGTLISGTKTDGIFRFQLPSGFPQFSEQGTWTVALINLSDRVGNTTVRHTDELNARGFNTQLVVQAGASSVSCAGAQNLPPTGSAGSTQTVTSGQLVALQGSGSDPEGRSLTFSWSQVQGPSAIVSNANSANASFIAPQVTASTVLRFKLTVSDGSLTAEAFVNVTVTPPVTTTQTMFFAQFANGGGITSDVLLTNPSGTTVTGTLELHNDNGQSLTTGFIGLGQQNRIAAITIPAYGVVTLSTDGQGSLVSGSARVTSSGTLGGVIRFAIPGIGVAGVPDSQALSSGITPVRRTSTGINTGVAVADAGGVGTSLTLTLRNSSGIQVATANLSVAANGHVAKFIDELFPSINTSTFEGTLTITAVGTGKVSAVAIELGNVSGQFTALPVTPLR
jgi:hypothetical protein